MFFTSTSTGATSSSTTNRSGVFIVQRSPNKIAPYPQRRTQTKEVLFKNCSLLDAPPTKDRTAVTSGRHSDRSQKQKSINQPNKYRIDTGKVAATEINHRQPSVQLAMDNQPYGSSGPSVVPRQRPVQLATQLQPLRPSATSTILQPLGTQQQAHRPSAHSAQMQPCQRPAQLARQQQPIRPSTALAQMQPRHRPEQLATHYQPHRPSATSAQLQTRHRPEQLATQQQPYRPSNASAPKQPRQPHHTSASAVTVLTRQPPIGRHPINIPDVPQQRGTHLHPQPHRTSAPTNLTKETVVQFRAPVAGCYVVSPDRLDSFLPVTAWHPTHPSCIPDAAQHEARRNAPQKRTQLGTP